MKSKIQEITPILLKVLFFVTIVLCFVRPGNILLLASALLWLLADWVHSGLEQHKKETEKQIERLK